MEIPSSKHMLELAYRWPLEKAIETSVAGNTGVTGCPLEPAPAKAGAGMTAEG